MASKFYTKSFATVAAWRAWLRKYHRTRDEIWILFYKKASGKKTIVYAEALDEALCFGWIDGQLRGRDDVSYLQRYTPRRERSVWSKNNIAHVARLTKEGRMQPAGLAEVERAKADGRWQRAYDSPRNARVPADFLRELRKNQKAAAFFQTLSKANRYAIVWRLQTAKKPETRARRIKMIVGMLAEGRKFH